MLKVVVNHHDLWWLLSRERIIKEKKSESEWIRDKSDPSGKTFIDELNQWVYIIFGNLNGEEIFKGIIRESKGRSSPREEVNTGIVWSYFFLLYMRVVIAIQPNAFNNEHMEGYCTEGG